MIVFIYNSHSLRYPVPIKQNIKTSIEEDYNYLLVLKKYIFMQIYNTNKFTFMKAVKLITTILLGLTLTCACTNNNKKNKKTESNDDRGYIVKVGQEAPDFTTLLTDSTTFTLSDYRGKVVMLQFTASWCGVCRKEMPHIEKDIWQPLKDKGLVLVGVDRGEPMGKIIDFAKKMEVTYPLALDEDSKIFELYARKDAGVTRNVIINKEGEIVFLTRLFDEEEFKAMIEEIKRLL